ncbi:MAG: phosphoenolpyruvate-protein phosphotransferase PtsI [Rhodothermia bacterium]|nr:MAG: phosphoenolpyruvate-protein phosphotransferase PtsI [Rhodothermia bacterium]
MSDTSPTLSSSDGSADEEASVEEHHLSGIDAAPGIAIGPAYLYAKDSFDIEKRALTADELQNEPARFEKAVQRAERDLKKIIDVTRDKLGEESAVIFEAQLMMLRDDALYSSVLTYIAGHKVNAGYAVHKVMSKHRKVMEASDSEYLRERAHDLQDVQDRIVRHLRRGRILSAIDAETIVVAESLTAADMILFSRKGILGCATDFGGQTSHVSIMARALGLPAVVSMHSVTERVEPGETLILDGIAGEIIVNPSPETLKRYRTRKERYARLLQEEKQLVPLAAETIDGYRVGLEANLELREEIPLLKEYGAEGVGLFRTEILLLMEGRLSISEDEQFLIYKTVVENAVPGSTTFRVLDLGGDKLLPMAHREHNPFLGWRGIRVLLAKPDILVPQLRAILRASMFGPTRVLLPMVTSLAEITLFREIFDGVKDDLKTEGIDFDSSIPVGVMVEVPAVAIMADQFAEVVDFFSIGTNDLTQYTLAVDRGNDLVSDLYEDMHPAVLQMIKRTVEAAERANIPVSLCGELATNLRAVPVLLGLGVQALSASPVYLPAIKRVIRAMTLAEGKELATKALESGSVDEIRQILDQWLYEHESGISFFLNSDESAT